jgi:hypothetical protein
MTKPTKETVEKNMARNNWFDRAVQGAAAFGMLYLAFRGLEPIIRASYPVKQLIGVGLLSFLLYALVAPAFRK